MYLLGEKPHSCEVCGKPFRVRSDMKRHLKTHGRKKNTGTKTTTQVTPSDNSDIIITKIEEGEVETSGGMSEDSNDERKEEIEASVQSIQFDADPLDTSRAL